MDTLKDLSDLSDKIKSFKLDSGLLNLSSLGIQPLNKTLPPSFVIRQALEHEIKLVGPEYKHICEDVSKSFSVNPNLNGTDGKTNKEELEEFYNKTVDLADICGLEDVNQRITDFANKYEEIQLSLSSLEKEKARFTPSAKLIAKLSNADALEAEYNQLLSQQAELQKEIQIAQHSLAEKNSVLDSLKILSTQADNRLSASSIQYDNTFSSRNDLWDYDSLESQIEWLIDFLERSSYNQNENEADSFAKANLNTKASFDKLDEILHSWDAEIYSHKTLNWIHDALLNHFSPNGIFDPEYSTSLSLFDDKANLQKGSNLIKALIRNSYSKYGFLDLVFLDNQKLGDLWVKESLVQSELLKNGVLKETDEFQFKNILFPLVSKKLIGVNQNPNSSELRSTWNQ
ncbi:hypothetical protein BB560_002010 [Smittium megazygosporum]|uniref:Uncharacterized protein n=1 Tax=Smittium megazygosporum TaxID=133381 RepID=A0A2T9ZFY9_9FUNG|nr:hypothetical protein BB560_002010 [Smittium megazygosporum]